MHLQFRRSILNPSDLIEKNRSELVAMLKEVMFDGAKSGTRKLGDTPPVVKSVVWLKSPYGKRQDDIAETMDESEIPEVAKVSRSDNRFLQLQGLDNHMAHMSRPR